MDSIRTLADPALVARFQHFFGVELVKPDTCDQQTQTKRPSLNSLVEEEKESTCKHTTHIATSCEGISQEKCPVCNQETSVVQVSKTEETFDNVTTPIRRKNSKTTDVEHNNNGITSPSLINSEQKYLRVTNRDSGNEIDEDRVSQINHCNGNQINSCDARTSGNDANVTPIENSISVVAGEKMTKTEIEKAVRIKYKSLLYLAYFGAFLGNEEFYLTFFPFCVWNVDFLIVRQVGLLWGLVMYLGQATKDYLRWPRPQCPPVVRLETSHIQEFAMPSTHAMAGTAIPLYFTYLAVVRYQVPLPIALTLALLWFSTTCFSRLYLGVHTVLDLIVGTLYAVVIFLTFMRYIEGYDLYQQTHPFAPIMILTTALLMSTFFYPSINKNSSKGDAVQIVASVAGCSLGAWFMYQLGYSHYPETLKPYEIQIPTISWFLWSMLRFITGLIMLVVSYVGLRKSTIQSFSYLYGLDVPDKTNPSVMTAYKFTTYGLLGFIITFIIPLIHTWFGINRSAIFTEVL